MKVMQGKAWERARRAGDKETETEALVPAMSKQDHVFELQAMNLKMQSLSWFKQALNLSFVICIAIIFTSTSVASALRSQQDKADSRPSCISGSEKDASFSIFGFRVHGNIHTLSANQ